MAEVLEVSDQEFKTTVMNVLMEKVDDVLEQTGIVSREMGTLRKNQEEMLETETPYQKWRMPVMGSGDLTRPRK